MIQVDLKLENGDKYGVDDTGERLEVNSLDDRHLIIKYYDLIKDRYVEVEVGRWVKVKYKDR